eukprot:COSAG06_NODE_683_length_13114_cov_7.121322_17_plen_90_part_00
MFGKHYTKYNQCTKTGSGQQHNETLKQESFSFRRLLSLGASYGGRDATSSGGGGAAGAGVRKRVLFAPFDTKQTEHLLPRQARDEHGKS